LIGGDHDRNDTGLGGDVRLAAAGRSGRPAGLGAPPAALRAIDGRVQTGFAAERLAHTPGLKEGPGRFALYHELASLAVRIADDPAFQDARKRGLAPGAALAMDKVLWQTPLDVASARNLLRRYPDASGWLFNTDRELFETAQTAHYQDPDSYFRVSQALEAFDEQDYVLLWTPADDLFLEEDSLLSAEDRAGALKYLTACVHNLTHCRPPEWLRVELGVVQKTVQVLLDRLRRTRDLFAACACIEKMEAATKELRDHLDAWWPKEDAVEEALR
jgi:hypothetical protein